VKSSTLFNARCDPEEALHVDAAQGGSVEPMPQRLRADIADEVHGRVGVAVETGDAERRLRGPPIIRKVELLLRKTA
jgi:hypothetical protein